MKRSMLLLGVSIMAVSLALGGCGLGQAGKSGDKKDVDVKIKEEDDEEEEKEKEKKIKEKDDEEEEEEQEKEKKGSKKSSKGNSKLGDDLYSFKVSIDGTIYQFPMTYEAFTDLGWEYDGDDTETLEANSYTVAERFNLGDDYIFTQIYNLSADEDSAISDCMIGGVDIDSGMMDDLEVVLPGGIEYGNASKDEIIDTYGEPTDVYDGDDDYWVLTYEAAMYQKVKFTLTEGNLSEVSIENLTDPDESEVSNDDVEKLDIVEQYEAPTKLSSKLKKFTVDFAGDLYALPAPVSEFLDNGFKIVSSESDMEVEAGSYGWVTLMKDNQSMRVVANNYADVDTEINNCFATEIEVSENDCDLPCEVSNDISYGMSEKKLKEALEDIDYETSDSESFTFYNVNFKDEDGSYCFVVNKESKKVSGIEVQHDPSAEDLFGN